MSVIKNSIKKTRRHAAVSLLLVPLLFSLLTLPNGNTGFAQQQNFVQESLFVVLFSDGNALIEYDVRIIDPEAIETRIELFGKTNTDLIVVDYEDRLVEFEQGSAPNEILIPAISNGTSIRINYQTADLVDKIDRIWTFSLDSPIGFSVKLPPDSFVIDWGVQLPTSIRKVGDQDVLIFDKGSNIAFSYILGFLGTEDQANANIKLAQITIREATTKYPDIILADAQSLLNRAIEAKGGQRFADAEKLAIQADDLAVATQRDYLAAQSGITNAEEKISTATEEDRETSYAAAILQQAKSEFSQGRYVDARDSANDAIASIGPKRDNTTFIIAIIAIAAAGAGSAAGAIYIAKRRQAAEAAHATGRVRERREEKQKAAPNSNAVLDKSGQPPLQQNPEPIRDNNIEAIRKEREKGPLPSGFSTPSQNSIAGPLEPSSTSFAAIPESQTDKSRLSRIVQRIIVEKPSLRPEDQDVLKFLAENEGAAFESELRIRFQLPKTTIWRLVKRLEREELVEVRKAGGQNLIKLRFEDRQP